MHESSMARMNWFVDKYLKEEEKLNILDVGSYNVNGCYRNIFENKGFNYEGLDMQKGPNVDIVPKHIYFWEEVECNKYDVVVSGQALEHVEFFWETVSEIVRVTKKDGLICIIAPNGFKEHRYPVDCWRFFTDGMVALAKYYQLEIIHAHTNRAPSPLNEEWFSEDMADSMLIAKKNYSGETKKINLMEDKCKPANHNDISGGFTTYEEYLEADKLKNNDQCGNHSEQKMMRKLKKIGQDLRKIIKQRYERNFWEKENEN